MARYTGGGAKRKRTPPPSLGARIAGAQAITPPFEAAPWQRPPPKPTRAQRRGAAPFKPGREPLAHQVNREIAQARVQARRHGLVLQPVAHPVAVARANERRARIFAANQFLADLDTAATGRPGTSALLARQRLIAAAGPDALWRMRHPAALPPGLRPKPKSFWDRSLGEARGALGEATHLAGRAAEVADPLALPLLLAREAGFHSKRVDRLSHSVAAAQLAMQAGGPLAAGYVLGRNPDVQKVVASSNEASKLAADEIYKGLYAPEALWKKLPRSTRKGLATGPLAAGFALPETRIGRASVKTGLEALTGLGPGTAAMVLEPKETGVGMYQHWKRYYGPLLHGDPSPLYREGLTPAVMDALLFLGPAFGAAPRIGALGRTARFGGEVRLSTEGEPIGRAQALGRAAAFGQEPVARVTPSGDVYVMGRRVPIRQLQVMANVEPGDRIVDGDVVTIAGRRKKVIASQKNGLVGEVAPHPDDPVEVNLGGRPVRLVQVERARDFAQRMVPRSRFGQEMSDWYWNVRKRFGVPGKRFGTGGARKRILRQELEAERDRQTAVLHQFRADARAIQADPGLSMAFDRMLRYHDPEAAIAREIELRNERGLNETREQKLVLRNLEQALEHVRTMPPHLADTVRWGKEIADDTEDFLVRRGYLNPHTAVANRVAAERWLLDGHASDEPLSSPVRTQVEDELRDQFSEEMLPLAMQFTDTLARAWARREPGRDPADWYEQTFKSVRRVSQDEMQATIARYREEALAQFRPEEEAPDIRFTEKQQKLAATRAKKAISGEQVSPATNRRIFRQLRSRRIQILGPISPKNWAARVRVVFGDPALLKQLGEAAIGRPFRSPKEAIEYYARWYEHFPKLMEQVFGEEAGPVMRAFGVSQANASPTFGLEAVFRVADRLANGHDVTQGELSLVADNIKKAYQGRPIDRFVGAKLSDFIDSLLGKETRTWTGHDPDAGAPGAVDVHTMRDFGRVDKKLLARLKELWGIEDAHVDVKGSPTKVQYETIRSELEDVAQHLNDTRFMGRKGWTAAQAQALGWATIQLLHGRIPEDLGMAINAHRRTILLEVTGGRSGFGGELSAPESSALLARVMPDIEQIIGQRQGRLVDSRVDIGGWGDSTNATAGLTVVGSRESVEAIMRDLAEAYDQHEVIAVRGGQGGGKNMTVGVEVFNEAFADTHTADLFWRNLYKAAQATKGKAKTNFGGFQKIRGPNGEHGIRIVTKQKALKVGVGADDAYVQELHAWIDPVLDQAARDSNLEISGHLRNATTLRANGWMDTTAAGPHLGRGLDDPTLAQARGNLLDGIAELRGARPATAATGELPGSGFLRGSPGLLAQSLREVSGRDLEGLPAEAVVLGWDEPLQVHSNAELQTLADQWVREQGREYDAPARYAKVDPQRAERIANAFEAAVHTPTDPAVQASYRAFADETLSQYRALEQAGYRFEFMPPGEDPYAVSPRLGQVDLAQNKHLYVFSTEEGYGMGAITDAMRLDNPLLEIVPDLEWNGRPVTYNDLFRAVHDVFGHAKEGVGFRADGEENAWRSHAAMYSPEARGAMTAETRGQNSWVNYGRFGAFNRKANTYATVFSDQKTTLLPEWVTSDGLADPELLLPQERRVRPEIPEPQTRIYGLARLTQDGAHVLLDADRADLATWVHETLHAILPGRWNEAESIGDVRLEPIRKALGLKPDEPLSAEAQEQLTRFGEVWLRNGGAIPAPQMRVLMDNLSKSLRDIYTQGIRDIARSKEEADLFRGWLKDPNFTSFLRDSFDVAPLKDFDPTGLSFVSTQLRPRTGRFVGFRRSILRPRTDPTGGRSQFIRFEEGTYEVGPDSVYLHAVAEIRHRVAEWLAGRAQSYSEAIQFVGGNPQLRDGYEVYNPTAFPGAQRQMDALMESYQRYGEGEGGDAVLDMHPDDLMDNIDQQIGQIATATFANSLGEAEARSGLTSEAFREAVANGEVRQIPKDIADSFRSALAAETAKQSVMSMIGGVLIWVLRFPNIYARWNMIGKVGYTSLNTLGTAALEGLNQGPALITSLGRDISYSRGTRLRLLSEIGGGHSELADLPAVRSGSFMRDLARKEQRAFATALRILSAPENRLRVNQIIHELGNAGYRSEADVVALLDRAKGLEDPTARALLNQVGRWAEDAVIRFRGLSAGEQLLMRDAFFVYGWLRAATRFTLQFPLNRPVTAGVAFNIGQYGWEKLQEEFFALTREHAAATILGERKVGNEMLLRLLDTSQILPFQTGRQVLDAIGSIAGLTGHSPVPPSLADFSSPLTDIGLTAFFGEDPRYGTSFFDTIKEFYSAKNVPLFGWISRFIDPNSTATKVRAPRDRAGIVWNFLLGAMAPYEIKESVEYTRWLQQQPPEISTVIREENKAATLALQGQTAARVGGQFFDATSVRAINARGSYNIFTSLWERQRKKETGNPDYHLTPVERAAAQARILHRYYPDVYSDTNARNAGLNPNVHDDAVTWVQNWNDSWRDYVSTPISDVNRSIKDNLGTKAEDIPQPIERWQRDRTWLQSAPPDSIARIDKEMRDQGIKIVRSNGRAHLSRSSDLGPLMRLVEDEMARVAAAPR
jgi:hypothetical protein